MLNLKKYFVILFFLTIGSQARATTYLYTGNELEGPNGPVGHVDASVDINCNGSCAGKDFIFSSITSGNFSFALSL
jgi:hypothetical protein